MSETDWINGKLKRLEDAEDEIVAYQIAKDNLELRLARHRFAHSFCGIGPEAIDSVSGISYEGALQVY